MRKSNKTINFNDYQHRLTNGTLQSASRAIISDVQGLRMTGSHAPIQYFNGFSITGTSALFTQNSTDTRH